MVYVARDSTSKRKLAGRTQSPLRTVTLTCGHTTDGRPGVSNPDRWFCCGQWRPVLRSRPTVVCEDC